MAETWKPIPGYEGYYEVSDMGRVRSLDREVVHPQGKAMKRGRLMGIRKIWSGYCKVHLSMYGRPRSIAVHRIVCEVFHGAPPTPMHHAAHINGVRDDNRASNLLWKTARENEQDKERHGTKPKGDRVPPESRARGEGHGCAKLTADQVVAIREVSAGGVPSRQIAKLLNVSKTTISHIITQKTWRHI